MNPLSLSCDDWSNWHRTFPCYESGKEKDNSAKKITKKSDEIKQHEGEKMKLRKRAKMEIRIQKQKKRKKE